MKCNCRECRAIARLIRITAPLALAAVGALSILTFTK